jgi:DNA-binding MarR family transcriptional regulator
MGAVLRQRIKQEKFRNEFHEAILNLIVAADSVKTDLDILCSRFGLSGPQYNVLRILRGAYPDGYPRCEIIERMLERAPDVTRLVDRLESSGLVVRDRSERDRRLSVTRITEKGIDLLNRIRPELDRLEDSLAERISREDCHELSRICEGFYERARE